MGCLIIGSLTCRRYKHFHYRDWEAVVSEQRLYEQNEGLINTEQKGFLFFKELVNTRDKG